MEDAPLLILDRQHGGKRSPDPGAWADVDGDGKREVWEQEVELTPRYIGPAQIRLAAAGVPSLAIDPQGAGEVVTYAERHRRTIARAKEWPAPVAYGAAHLNAGRGDYGLIGFSARRPADRALAEAIAAELEARVPVLSRCKVQPWSPAVRGWACIAGLDAAPPNLAGVLLEPLFVDHPDHAAWIRDGGLTVVGEAIADGFLAWARSRA